MTVYTEARYTEQYSAGTNNPGTVGSTFQRNLNTEMYNGTSGSIEKSTSNAGAITLTGPGIFCIDGDAYGHNLTGPYQNELKQIGGGATVTMTGGIGVSQNTPLTGYTSQSKQSSYFAAQVVITDTSSVDIAIQTNYGGSASGNYGTAVNLGNPEVYGWMQVRQVG
jgi:hypothetical protein